MILRTELKEKYNELYDMRTSIQCTTEAYIKELDGRRGIYISDHAIRRYLERVKGFTLNDELSDIDYIRQVVVPLEVIRDEMLTLVEDREILRGQKQMYKRGRYSYIIKELCIVTVLQFINS